MSVDVKKLHVVVYPDKALRTKAKPVAEITDEVRAVAKRMIELMREEDGIGLAAPQVGLSWRMFVVHVPESDDRSAQDDPPSANTAPEICINPKFPTLAGAPEPLEEGCLSLPEIRGEVLRPPVITMTWTDAHGKPQTRTAGGLLARCWQHEMDHLDGVLIIDKMTQMSRLKNRTAVRDLERDAGER